MSKNSSQMTTSDGSWLGWFHSLPVNTFLCRVPDDFLKYSLNLTDLEPQVPNFDRALDIILDTEFDKESGFNSMETDVKESTHLYGLIHARYLLTPDGINDMCLKYKRGDFGSCPRIHCEGQFVLPVGLADNFGESRVKVYCPRCQDVYQPYKCCTMLDGAIFGSSFPHLFFMQWPQLRPQPPTRKYTPRLYGFKLHKSALLPPPTESPSDNNDNSSSKAKVGTPPALDLSKKVPPPTPLN
ncbi:suppressor-of-stellate-like protein [Drosophila grimshawi]|uniref:suppressor-of-stellate-like protein n=1 Tax=Drosophila grimshawi TaxID=7222 RepID=UPI000C87041B|nr:suppressor-of-stellate-like protein [Drosophila grimshawi]